MKKILFILMVGSLFISCSDDYAPTEHSHDGICARSYYLDYAYDRSYRCYSTWDEQDCLRKEEIESDDDNSSYAYFYITCEEFCAQTTDDCDITSSAP